MSRSRYSTTSTKPVVYAICGAPKKTFPAEEKCPVAWMQGGDAISGPETKSINRWISKL